MVQPLIPRILKGQQGARAAQGIIEPGMVITTRVRRDVAIYQPPVLTLDVEAIPDTAPPRNRIRGVGVPVGGRFDATPSLHVIHDATVVSAARFEAVLDGVPGAIASVTVTDGGEYIGRPTRIIAVPPPRTLTADVEVFGRGGRPHILTGVPCAIPVRIGDPVLLEIANGDPRRGAYVSGLQVPRRPLIEIYDNAPTPVEAGSRWRIGEPIPVRGLGWQQGFTFAATAVFSLTWEGEDTADPAAPAMLAFSVTPRLEVLTETSGDWTSVEELGSYVAHVNLSKVSGVSWTGACHWAGVCAPNESLVGIYEGAAAISLGFYVGAGSHQVKWARPLTDFLTPQEIQHGAYNPGIFWKQDDADLENHWQQTAPADLTITSYRLQVAELGMGTW